MTCCFFVTKRQFLRIKILYINIHRGNKGNSIMGLQKVAFNFIVERGGKLAKSLLCSKPIQKPINFKGLKYATQIQTDSIKIERKLSDFAQENREFLEEEFTRLFSRIQYPVGVKRTLRNGIRVPASKSEIQELLYHVKDDYDVLVINNLNKSGFKIDDICELMNFPQKRILQCISNYKPYYKEIKACSRINAEQLKYILTQYPNLKEKYFSMLFDIEIPIAGEMRKLTWEEILKILKSQKTHDKFMRVINTNKTTKSAIRVAESKVPPSGTVPRFIYHMTSKENYLKILESGQLKASGDDFIAKGVFMTDLENLFKHWGRNYAWGEESLQARLLRQCKKRTDELVILKIPTSALDYQKLSIRSQQRGFSYLEGNKDELIEFVRKDLMRAEYEEKDAPNMVLRSINRYLDKFSRQDRHIYTGSPVCESKLFKQRKEAIEYIYSEPIKIDKTTKIGEVNVEELRSSPKYDPMHPIRTIFTELLSDTPEVKGVNLIKE